MSPVVYTDLIQAGRVHHADMVWGRHGDYRPLLVERAAAYADAVAKRLTEKVDKASGWGR